MNFKHDHPVNVETGAKPLRLMVKVVLIATLATVAWIGGASAASQDVGPLQPSPTNPDKPGGQKPTIGIHKPTPTNPDKPEDKQLEPGMKEATGQILENSGTKTGEITKTYFRAGLPRLPDKK